MGMLMSRGRQKPSKVQEMMNEHQRLCREEKHQLAVARAKGPKEFDALSTKVTRGRAARLKKIEAASNAAHAKAKKDFEDKRRAKQAAREKELAKAAPKPAVEADKPAVEADKPAVEADKPAVEADNPAG